MNNFLATASMLLLEDRIDFLKDKNPAIDSSHDDLATHRDSSSIIDHFAKYADPTKSKIHTQWILNQYKSKNVRQEDVGRIHDTLSNFEKYKPKLQNKDINQYNNLSDIDSVVAPHIGSHVSKKSENREIKSEGAELVHSDPESGMTIHHIKTESAAKLYGKGTKWCTAAEKNCMFDRYNKSGKLFVIQHGGEKYQYHRETAQFMNDQDSPVSKEQFNKIKTPLLNAWKSNPEIAPSHNSHIDLVYGDKSESEISTALADPDPSIRADGIKNVNATAEHISKALDDDNGHVASAAMASPGVTTDHITKALSGKSIFSKIAAARHPKATSEHITKALGDEDPSVRETAIANPNATTEHVAKALNDSVGNVRWAAIQNPKATPEHISKALDDSAENVRFVAIFHKNVTPEHITKALDDEREYVRWTAIQNPKATPEHISKALDDSAENVRFVAIQNPKATPEHISKALNDSDENVRWTAIRNPKANSEHITKALGDESMSVRKEAKTIWDKMHKITESTNEANHKAELLSEDTTLRYHHELNPKVWDSEGNLRADVEAHLMKIANDWIEFAKIPTTAIRDIVLTGGNCNYNYTSQSDLDVHVMVKYSEVSDNQVILRDYYMAKKSLWASRHGSVSVVGYPVELFAQDVSEKPHKGQGVFSLTNSNWIQKPDYLGLDLEHDYGVEYSAKEFVDRINSTINNNRGYDSASALADSIYDMRGKGIAAEGEFSKGTLIFKELRNLGLVDKLNKYITEAKDTEYSLS